MGEDRERGIGMSTLVANAIEKFIFHLLQGVLQFVGSAVGLFGQVSLMQTELPWVTVVRTDILTVTWTLFTLYFAYIALTRYILWHEGTADTDGSVLMKSVLRSALYIGLSATLATLVWTFGFNLANELVSSPMAGAITSVSRGLKPLQGMQGISSDVAVFVAGVGAMIIVIVALMIMLVQFAIRSAEIVFYVLAGPLMGLGHLASPEGGVWARWWTNLVILSLSAAPQLLALKGMVASTTAVPVATATAHNIQPLVLAWLMQLGWIVVGIRGPHMLKEWAYRSGAGSGFVGVATNVGQTKLKGFVGTKS